MSQPVSSYTFILSETKATLSLALPIMGAQLAQMGMAVIDTMMAGHLSALALAAIALGTSVQLPLTVFLFGLLVAISPSVAQDVGRGYLTAVGQTVRQSLWLCLLLMPPSMAMLWWSAPVLDWFAVDAQIQPLTIGYLQAFTWSLPAYLLVLAARFFAEGLGHGRTVFVVSMLALPLNVLANYALMYGAWGFPRLGAVGTGYATSLVWSFMAMVLWVIFLRRKAYQCYQIQHWQLPNIKVMLALVKIGFPIGLAVSMEVCMFALIGLFIGGLGMAAVAANQIAMNITSLIFMVPLGISNAITARVGRAVGEGSANVQQVAYIGIALCLLFIMPLSVGLLLAAEYWVSLYTDVLPIQLLAVQLLWIAVLYQIFDALQLGTNGALRGLKDTRIPMFYTLIAYWCIGMPVGWWLSFPHNQGAAGFWTGIVLAFFCAALFQQIRLLQLLRCGFNAKINN